MGRGDPLASMPVAGGTMGKTLLLADDSVTIQKVVGISFASEDISITTVDNGDDALAKVKELRPDVVLADVVMPGMSGYEVCEAIKADPTLSHIPVLLLTGTFEAFDKERASRVGAAGQVSKPFEAQTLVDQVKELLAKAPAPPPAAEASPSPAPAAGSVASDDDAFDFFDEPAEGSASRDTAVENLMPGPDLDDSFDSGSSDGAFAFGDDDLAAPAPSPSPAEATVAIFPEDSQPQSPRQTPEIEPAPQLDPSATTLDPAMLEGIPSASKSSANAPPPPAGEGYDFDFGGEGSDAASVDIAQATIMDPDLASNFAVSSSDLDSTSPAAEADTTPPPLADDVMIAEPIDDAVDPGVPADSPGSEGLVQAAPEPVGAAPDPSEMNPAPGTPDWATPMDEDAPPIENTPAAAAITSAPAAAPPGTVAELSVESLVAQVSPTLGTELHQTLEKIAWESIGPVTEKIVSEMIERIETVAWEVVPKLAETLIQEEIRKLKGGSK